MLGVEEEFKSQSRILLLDDFLHSLLKAYN